MASLQARPTVSAFRRAEVRNVVVASAIASPGAAPKVKTIKALKEWSVVIGALGTGEQTVLLRKGGIKEPTFKPEASEFLLFPTAFHVTTDVLKPGVAERFAKEMALDPKKESVLPLPVYAQVTGAWTTSDPSAVSALSPLHVGSEAFLDAKLKWRGGQPLTVLELRAWRLKQPAQLAVNQDLFGCFSWLDLSEALSSQAISLEGAEPCLPEGEFKARQAALREQLALCGAQELKL